MKKVNGMVNGEVNGRQKRTVNGMVNEGKRTVCRDLIILDFQGKGKVNENLESPKRLLPPY